VGIIDIQQIIGLSNDVTDDAEQIIEKVPSWAFSTAC